MKSYKKLKCHIQGEADLKESGLNAPLQDH
jgi:hypothetical protein